MSVADDRGKLVETDNLPDEETSDIFIVTKSSTSKIPICFVTAEYSAQNKMVGGHGIAIRRLNPKGEVSVFLPLAYLGMP